jgi:hypothetical protein
LRKNNATTQDLRAFLRFRVKAKRSNKKFHTLKWKNHRTADCSILNTDALKTAMQEAILKLCPTRKAPCLLYTGRGFLGHCAQKRMPVLRKTM